MRLNHLNLCVDNIPESCVFFETHFGFHCIDLKGDGVIAVLEDDSGFALVLSHFDKTAKPEYPEAFHFGFIVESIEEVCEIHERLSHDGATVHGPPRKMRGVFGFYGCAPGGILFEVSTRKPAVV